MKYFIFIFLIFLSCSNVNSLEEDKIYDSFIGTSWNNILDSLGEAQEGDPEHYTFLTYKQDIYEQAYQEGRKIYSTALGKEVVILKKYKKVMFKFNYSDENSKTICLHWIGYK